MALTPRPVGNRLCDAMTNQQIIDFGASKLSGLLVKLMPGLWARVRLTFSLLLLSNAATRGGVYGKRQNGRQFKQYNARLSTAGNMFGQGTGMMSDANTTFNGAANSYGTAGNTFGDANTQAINNMNTSLGAGNYVRV